MGLKVNTNTLNWIWKLIDSQYSFTPAHLGWQSKYFVDCSLFGKSIQYNIKDVLPCLSTQSQHVPCLLNKVL